MGNESSSPRHHRDRYDDDETTIDGTSVFSENTRDTGFSGVSRDTGMSSRYYNRSSSKSHDPSNPLNVVLNSNLIDSICGHNFFEDDEEEDNYGGRRKKSGKKKSSKDKKKSRSGSRSGSKDNEDSYDSDGSYESEDDRRGDSGGNRSSKKRGEKETNDNSLSGSTEDFGSEKMDSKESSVSLKSNSKESLGSVDKASGSKDKNNSFESIGSLTQPKTTTLTKPLASSFAKRCYFTKAGIGKNMQHYEGITITGNTVLMLASAMKLKGCPTICDEDLRRVEETFPNQFSRLPDELLLSSGWRRISKYCHFSGKPIPDGLPFFHSRERCHPNGGYYFLLAASIGMERPSDVEPLTLDMLILLQTDYPVQCDQTPHLLIDDPQQWILVTRFCFFSGGPINSDEDVYYKANYNGNYIYMLAFLSPNMTPEELYRLNDITGESALKSVAAVEEVETVYDLTDRDFDDLKMYHLGPCRALPDHLLTPSAWEKVLPQHFLVCRENALARAYEYEVHAQEAVAKANKMMGLAPTTIESNQLSRDPDGVNHARSRDGGNSNNSYVEMHQMRDSHSQYSGSYQVSNSEDGTYDSIDEQNVHSSHQSVASHDSRSQTRGPHNVVKSPQRRNNIKNVSNGSVNRNSNNNILIDSNGGSGTVTSHQNPIDNINSNAEDPTVTDKVIKFDNDPMLADPRDDGEVDDPSIKDQDMLSDYGDDDKSDKHDIDNFDDPSMKPADHRALHEYYKGIEKQQV